MKITEDLKIQLERLKNTGAYILNKRMKKELQELTKQIEGRPITNLECGSCLRRAMHELNKHLSKGTKKPTLAFKGVKQIEEMTFKELKEASKAKGLVYKRGIKKIDLINYLNER